MHASTTDLHTAQSNVSVDRTVLVIDNFSEDLAAGRVIGTDLRNGTVRKGKDEEGIIGIDNGALRIQPLVNPGWGRSGIAYGPFTRRNGLAFGAFLVNGHNISRTLALPDGFKMRLWRWAIGTETEVPIKRLISWTQSPQKRFIWRRLVQWIRSGTRFFQVTPLDENLAVGWFPSEAPVNPLERGNALIVHAIVPEGGELWARTGSTCVPTVRGVQNIQMYYIVVLREKGAAYYAASMAGASGLGTYPTLRLLAIDAFNADEKIYAGIHQSVLGEIGFRADTRVYQTQVALLPEFANWYGSAHGADTLTGNGPLDLSAAETDGIWNVHEGEFQRTERGAVGVGPANLALLSLSAPVGLVHVIIESTHKLVEGIAIIWRAKDEDNFWCFEVGSEQCQLSTKEGGLLSKFPATKNARLTPNIVNSLQVFDDGENIRLYLNGDLVYGTTFSDTRLQDATGAGIRAIATEDSAWLRSFEAHPRSIPVPQAFTFNQPWHAEGNQVVISDDFQGPPGDLAGHQTSFGGKKWRKNIGRGVIQLTGHASAKVFGSVEQPCPGRTAYTLEWANPRFADLEVTITPPGTRKGFGEKGRAGLIFWQDPGNYFILSAFIGDWPAMSIAAFFQMDGFEELYDAVWSNVGNRMHLGVPHDFRIVFDGRHFLAFINREPVLYRALSDVYPEWDSLAINRVGIVANWEWGNDTGSVFQDFVVKDRVS
ncbi:MAG TPA: hypothetical protein VIS96_08805 [Terrimicrobiaceae bacterium]